MKVIFLDIDGVLNNRYSTSKCRGIIGIDDDKVLRLSEIVRATNAKVVLTSTWKSDWDKYAPFEDQSVAGQYMLKKLHKYGIKIFDKTEDDWSHRGYGIKQWINNFPTPVESFCILDDEYFDYDEEQLLKYLVKTTFYDPSGGLQDVHVSKAIDILCGHYCL